MRTQSKGLMILAALAFAAGTMIAAEAAAEVRFNAVVHTPAISVRIGTNPAGYPIMRQVRPLPARRFARRLARTDMQIAGRLSWYTRVPAGELLRYRRYGYGWYEIGSWLYIPRGVVRAAMHQGSWNRFLYAQGYDRRYRERHGEWRGHGEMYTVVYEYRR